MKRLRLSAAVFCLSFLGCGGGSSTSGPASAPPASPPATPSATEWTTFQGNPAHTGYQPLTLDSSKFKELWVSPVQPGAALNPLVSGGGGIYVSSNTYFGVQKLYALNPSTGSVIWSYNFGSIHGVHPPAFADGMVYVTTSGNTDAFLYAFKATDGTFLHRDSYGNQWERYYSPVVVNGTVYMGGGTYGGAYAFDGATGSQKWFTSLNQYDQWDPAVDASHVYAYTGSYAPEVTVMDRSSGSVNFNISDPGFVWSGWSMNLAPVLGASNDLLAIQGGRLLSFDLVGRKIGWQISASFVGQVSVGRGVLYAVNSSELEARSEADGAFKWAWIPTSGVPTGNIIVTDNLIFVSSGTATYAVDTNTHQTVWSYAKGGHLSLTASGTLLIATSDGQVAAISLQ